MALRNIIKEGDPALRKIARPVGEVTDRIRVILDDMVETMHANNGVGLAAPQVGIIRRMFVCEPEPGRVVCMVDPEILSEEGSQECEEGCLSVPGYVGTVTRPKKVTVKYKDRDGAECTMDAEDFAANVVCHEYDHLDGILYVDKARNVHIPEEDDD